MVNPFSVEQGLSTFTKEDKADKGPGNTPFLNYRALTLDSWHTIHFALLP
jgi:hypothetical protein